MLALHLLARFLFEVPVVRYVATCGPDMFERGYVRGPYNEQFLLLLENAMVEESFIYHRSGDEIYVPYIGFSNEYFDDYIDFSVNVDWKLVSSIADGWERDGRQFLPPAELVALIAATEPKYGPFPKRTAAGERIYGPDIRFSESEDACAFMRAAILEEPGNQERR